MVTVSVKSESDVTSLAPSSRSPSRSPKRAVYYVQSPSRDSDKSSSMQATPMESPSHPSHTHSHSRNSSGSASRFSGIFRSSSGRKWGRKRINDKGWPACDVILEEGSYDEFQDRSFSRPFQALLALCCFVLMFSVFCFILWGATRHYKAEITVKSLSVSNMYIGEGTDFTGVPTKMLTVNGSLKINIYNPATLFGIHVSSAPINLIYSEIPVATGQIKKYYQPRKSHRTIFVNLQGKKVPLYGAGSGLAVTENDAEVPLTLSLEIRSRGNVVGKLVRTRHRKQISCPLVINSVTNKPIKFKKDSCKYE